MLVAEKEYLEMEVDMQGMDTHFEPTLKTEMVPSMEYINDIHHDTEFKTQIRHSSVWTMIIRLDDFLSEAVA